jgi:hypothetical protein
MGKAQLLAQQLVELLGDHLQAEAQLARKDSVVIGCLGNEFVGLPGDAV